MKTRTLILLAALALPSMAFAAGTMNEIAWDVCDGERDPYECKDEFLLNDAKQKAALQEIRAGKQLSEEVDEACKAYRFTKARDTCFEEKLSVYPPRSLRRKEAEKYLRYISMLNAEAMKTHQKRIDARCPEGAAEIEVKFGMKDELVRNCTRWGEPRYVNRTSTSRGVEEQWVYVREGHRAYLYFTNGKLSTIQD